MSAAWGGPRRPDPRPEPAGGPARAAAQRHLDARQERLRAYAAALAAALDAGPPLARRAQLERHLDQARAALRAAAHPRLPPGPAGPAGLPPQGAGRGTGRRARAQPRRRRAAVTAEDEYELVRDGRVVGAEAHARSPATRWYTQEQAVALLREAGFAGVRLTSGFTQAPIRPEDTLFCALATRP